MRIVPSAISSYLIYYSWYLFPICCHVSKCLPTPFPQGSPVIIFMESGVGSLRAILVHTFMMPLVYQFLVGQVWWSILFDMVILIQRPLSLCIIQAPSQSIVDDVVQNNNKHVVTCNRNRCGNLERRRVSSNTPDRERNNKQLRIERAREGVYGIYHRRERLRNANYSTHWAE